MSLVHNDSQICTVRYEMMRAVNDVSFGQLHCFYLPAHGSGDAVMQVSLFVLISIMSQFKSRTAEIVRGLNNWLWSHSVVSLNEQTSSPPPLSEQLP